LSWTQQRCPGNLHRSIVYDVVDWYA
jgi:hypothetical protein